MFRVGQKVVCINTNGLVRVPNCVDPLKGEVYTIRKLFRRLEQDAVFLDEIVNPPMLWNGLEPCFFAFRFRPVVERKTDISIFTEILRKTSRKQTVKAH